MHASSTELELVSYSNENMFSLRMGHILASTTLDLDETVDNSSVLTTNNGKVVNAHLIRTFWSDGWNTICLPFSLSADEVTAVFGANRMLYTFTSATVKGEAQLDINMTEATAIEAGQPYILIPDHDVVNPTFDHVTISCASAEGESIQTESYTAVTFLGIINTYHIPAGDKQYLFVTATDELNWSEEGDTSSMYGFRAYFYVPDNVSGLNKSASPRARFQFVPIDAVVDIENTPTAITPSPLSEGRGEATKLLHNGHLYILKEGIRYSINGTINGTW